MTQTTEAINFQLETHEKRLINVESNISSLMKGSITKSHLLTTAGIIAGLIGILMIQVWTLQSGVNDYKLSFTEKLGDLNGRVSTNEKNVTTILNQIEPINK